MSLRQLPKVQAFQRPRGYEPDATPQALRDWAERPMAAAVTDDNIIEINDVIGEDWWSGGGFTSNRMSAALRSVGAKDVTVMINSPGGDVFEGLTIFNMLAAHPAAVTIQVMGLAASAASVIAMAGDKVLMSQGAMMMIHNAWGVVVGNRNDMAAGQALFGKIDASMADIYAAHTGLSVDVVAKMMDGPTQNSDGTWLTAKEAVDQKFADSLTDTTHDARARAAVDPAVMVRRRADALLAEQGMPRSERRALFAGIKGMPSAAQMEGPVMPRADTTEVMAALGRLSKSLTN